MLKRLTIEPIDLLLSSYGQLFFLGIIAVLFCPSRLRYWSYYAALCIILFWFGSTSFTSYQPMPIVDRMTLPVLPALIILVSYLISLYKLERKGFGIIHVAAVGLIISIILLPAINYAVKVWKSPLAEERAMSIVKKELITNPSERILLLTSDQRSSESLKFFFQYQYPKNLKVIHAIQPNDNKINLLEFNKIYVYINKNRSRFLKEAYGNPNADEKLNSLGLTNILGNDSVKLFKLEDTSKYTLDRLIIIIDDGDVLSRKTSFEQSGGPGSAR